MFRSRRTTWSTSVGQDAVADHAARQAPRLLLPGQLFRHEEHHGGDGGQGRDAPRPLHHRHDLRPHGGLSDDRGPSGGAARRIRPVQAGHRGSGGRMAREGHGHHAVSPASHHRPRPAWHPGEAVQADRPEPAGSDDRVGQEPLSVHLGLRLRRGGAARLEDRRAERGLQPRLAQPAAGQEAARRSDQARGLEIPADPDAGLGRSRRRSTRSISSTGR